MDLTLEYWLDDQWYVGRLRELPHCFSQGETLEELEENIKEVYQLFIEDFDNDLCPTNRQTKILHIAA